MKSFLGYLSIMLGLDNVIAIRKLKTRKDGRNASQPGDILRMRFRLVLLATWVMVIGFSLSLIGIIAFPLVRPGAEVPGVLPQLVIFTVGYLGGAFASFMRFDVSEE